METDHDPPVDGSIVYFNSPNGRPLEQCEMKRFLERGSRFWELPGTHQDPDFINKRIDNARQPFTIFEIVKDQQQSLTGANLTAAFIKLSHLTTHYSIRQELKKNKIFKATQNSSLFSDEEMANILWSLAQLEAEPPLEVMDTFMFSFYSRMDQVEIRVGRSDLNSIDRGFFQVLSTALWGLARLDYVPAEKVLVRACQSMAERLRLREGRLSDFCTCFWALAVMGYTPNKSILEDFIALGCACLGCLTPNEVAQMLWSFIQFGFHPGTSFLEVIDAIFCGMESMWSIEDSCMLFWGMATYGYPLNPVFINNIVETVQSAIDISWSILVRTLSACARYRSDYSRGNRGRSCRMCYHPGEQFMQMAANRLCRSVDEIYYEAIETVLWTCATFSFHPGCELLSKLANKVEIQCHLFSSLHLANILWCYALFDVCTIELWTVIIEAVVRCPIRDLPPEALYRLYQVTLLHSDAAFDLPKDFEEAGRKLWITQTEDKREAPSPFYCDVYRHLCRLGLNVRQQYPIGNSTISFYLESLNRGLELLDEHEFTINKTEHIGSAHMRTRIIRTSISKMKGPLTVDFLKYIDWHELNSDDEKQQFLSRLFKLHH